VVLPALGDIFIVFSFSDQNLHPSIPAMQWLKKIKKEHMDEILHRMQQTNRELAAIKYMPYY
jgi:hypothetical protein